MQSLAVLTPKVSPILSMIRTAYPEYHPLMSIARIAHDTDDQALEFACHKTIARFVEPELKSMEVRMPVDDTRRVRVSLFDVVDITPEMQPQIM